LNNSGICYYVEKQVPVEKLTAGLSRPTVSFLLVESNIGKVKV
jgi:hypothetical protein